MSTSPERKPTDYPPGEESGDSLGIGPDSLPTREASPTATPASLDAQTGVESQHFSPGPGSVIGNYRILHRIGAGGMGEVFKAIHVTMEREVALKMLAPHLLREERAKKRFQREVRNAARLAHPNIVIAHDAAEDQGRWFLVMEYVDGVDLADLVARDGVMPVQRACAIVREVALGLQHAFELGMVHRDIKPANIIIANPKPGSPPDDLPQVKILDFGLSRIDDSDNPSNSFSVTREGCVVGTPEFMSPEQATNSRMVDCRSDIYSLGCTLHYLVSGQPPFVADSAVVVFTRHLHEAPEPLDRLRPGIPAGLSDVVNRMLAKRPADRYSTPAEVAAALAPFAGVRSRAAARPGSSATAVAKPAPAAPAGARPASQPLPPDPAGGTSLRALAWVGLFLGLLIVAATAWVFFGHRGEVDGNSLPNGRQDPTTMKN
jgi:serine/threonine-protein kinase